MKTLRLLALLFVFPLFACTDTNGFVFPYKAVTNILSYTNSVTNVTIKQVNWHFKTASTGHAAYAVWTRENDEWLLLGTSKTNVTHWVMATQANPPQEFVIQLLSVPKPPSALRAFK